jgi:glucose-6-phosphate 1-dehydrogenase
MTLEVTSTGMAKGAPPDPCMVVIFGVAGDLARHTLIPSLYVLGCQGLLPEPFAIIGFARREWDDKAFREHMRDIVRRKRPFREAQWQKFARGLMYVHGDFSSPASDAYATLRERITKIQAERRLPDNILFHLSTPPSFYGEIAQKLADASLLHSDHGWRRMIIEKPFGYDEASARALDCQLLRLIDEEHLYRIDHFLGKETVQNMLVFRFANPGFEPIWNRNYIDHVQITAAESEGIGTRAGYYESAGVVRDMLQNHLLQLLCITAMEPPVAYDGISLRNETFKVLQALEPVNLQSDCVLGQYGPGMLDGYPVRGYREEEDVPSDSITPTFAAVKLMPANWRWAGVPFYLRTGKRLLRKLTQISIHFKPTPHLMFPVEDPGRLQQNILVFRLQPEEGIIHTFLAKQPGPDICLRPVRMHFAYNTTFCIDEPPSAYEWLLLDAMLGNQTLFPRSDWIYKAWSIVDPIVKHWEAEPPNALPNYPAGSWGPAAADALLKRDGPDWYTA